MNARLQLDGYIAQARRRLHWVLASQGAALGAGALLLLTLLAALALGQFAFADGLVLTARLLLLAAVLAVVAWYLLRARALRRDGGAALLEQALPSQGGRVATYLQESARQGSASVLLDLLAEDAQRIADQQPLASAIPARRLWLPGAIAVLCIAGLVGTLQLGGMLGEAAQRLWLGRLPPAATIAAAAGGIAVQPGDTTVRRNQDLGIGALVARGGSEVTVHVRFDSGGEWETAAMQADGKGGYAFTLFAVREAARYYVTSGSLRSAEHRIDVVDLPQIESLRLTYDYPAWTGLARRTEESGGDIRAVSGTRVALEVVTDKPLQGPLLVINGSESGLSQSGATSRGSIAVKQPGHYRIATRFGAEIVSLTQDFVIDIVTDEKPSVEILRPGRDYQATNIEEVPVSVRARDDFRLESLELHYSVNGGEWRSDKLPAGSTDIQAAALLRLEEMQQPGPRGESPLLVPGDLVSYYAMARDHASSAQTDLFLIQVQPFERRFTQSQANGGGGGGGGEEDEGQISQRQREVLLATWNLQRTKDATGDREAERAADNARMLAEVQQTLADQATTLVERARARALTGQDENVATFVKSLEAAAKAMVPAVKSLNEQDLQAAVKSEQQALQHLLRAESVFRDIQVAMQSQGGGGGGGAQAGRDVSEMTELELDLEKNQYETEPQMSAQQSGQGEDETLRRLRELARRQEQLAREAERRSSPAEAQRWQQEQLRREAEQLRQQLEQMAQQRAQQQRGGSQGSSAQGGSQSASASAAEAARQVSEALQQMQQAQARGDRQAAQRASEQLNRAREQLEQGRQQADEERFANLTEQARELAERQRASERELRAAIGNRPPPSIASPRPQQQSGMSFEQMEQLSSSKRELQADLEALRRQIDTTRRQAQQQAPRASERLAQATQELQEADTAGSLSRSARDIERGRGVQAATREGLIGESLQRLEQTLEQAAATAATESGPRQQQGREADAGDLLAELGELRRALERARQQGLAQSQRGGDPGARSPNAREGQAGQDGGQSGQQGQGGQGQGGQGGSEPGEAGGANGGADGGVGDFGRAGGGSDRGGARTGQFIGGLRGGERVPLSGSERQALRQQTQLSAQRLQQLREQLQNGTLGAADVTALQELSQRLNRSGTDPMAAEYQRMVALVNQLELAALKAQQAKADGRPTRSTESVDDSRRYRDNVAEYYRRLGVPNER